MTLVAENVSVFYGEYQALNDVSVSFGPGQFVSIVGPNGAGKSTLVNVLSGLERPLSGQVHFKDWDIAGLGPVKLAKLGIARSFQLVSVFPDLTVWETIAVAVVSRLGRGGNWLASLSRDDAIGLEVNAMAELFQLSRRLKDRSGTLSQGEKKLLDIASAFALRPEVILLDEPTSGVSTAEKHAVMKVMVEAAKNVGVSSIIQVEHDMDLVFKYSDRIVAIHDGRVIADATPEEFRKDTEAMAKVIGKDLS